MKPKWDISKCEGYADCIKDFNAWLKSEECHNLCVNQLPEHIIGRDAIVQAILFKLAEE